MKRARALLLLPALVTLTGCLGVKRAGRPVVAIPPSYSMAPTIAATAPATQAEARWWKLFADPELDRLIERAASANLDLAQADARVRGARASVGVSRGSLYPESNLTADAKRQRSRFFTGLDPNGQPNLRPVEFNDFQFNFDASWELDFWGRVRGGYAAAKADLVAQQQDRRDVLVTLLSEVARNYTELRGSQLRLAIAARNQASEREIVHITEVLAKAGLSTERDVAQAKAALAALDATIPSLNAAVSLSAHRIGVLTGQTPETLEAELSIAGPLLVAPGAITVGLPSDLIERRPDIRRSEAQFQAAAARVGVARADYFPRFTLTATGGRDAQQFHDLSLGGSNIFGVGPSVSLPLFNAGRIASNVELERARTAEATARYKASVLNALSETEDALARHSRERERLALLEAEVAQQSDALSLSQVQYKAGLADFTTVLTAERDLQAAEDQAAQSRIAVTTNLIAVYKAIGGGWEIAPNAPGKP